MKKKIKLLLLMIITFTIFCLCKESTVKAASASISNNQTVTAGQTVTVTATVTAGAWNLTLSGGGQSQSLVGQTSIAGNQTASASITFVANSDTVVYLTGDMTDFSADNSEAVSKSTKITVQVPPTNNGENNSGNTGNSGSGNSGTSSSQGGQTQAKSNNANLTMIETSPVDFTGFRTNVTSGYSVTVENNVDRITVTTKKANANASVSLLNKTNSDTGKSWVYLVEGSNEVNVIVTAEDGKTQKTYTINVTRKQKTEEIPNEQQPEQNPEETTRN